MRKRMKTTTPSTYDGPYKSSTKNTRTQEERAEKKEEGELEVQFPSFSRAGGNWHRLS